MSKSGVILVLLGGVLLANNFGWLQWVWLRQWWPVLLIALGLWSIVSNKPGDRPASRDSDKRS